MKRLAAFALVAFTAQAGEIAVEWDRVPDSISTYVVRYGPSATNKIAAAIVGNTNRATIVNVPDGIEVFTEVVAVGVDGRVSDPSNTIRTFANSKPSTPLNLRPITNVFTISATVTNIITFQTVTQ